MGQTIVTLNECIFVVMLINDLSDGMLQIIDMLALILSMEGKAGEVGELWKIANGLHLHLHILLLNC